MIPEKRHDQIPALDGLRALAITMVIASHSRNDFVFAGGLESPHALFSCIDVLWTGVDLFFVLSGFLIGRILFQEVKRTGSVDVSSFLLKRGFRIWPLYYFVCTVTLLKLALTHALPSLNHVLPDYLFVTNYFDETLAFGSWSLSVEEQFYILISVILFLSSFWLIHSGKKIVTTLAGILVLAPMIRFLTWNHYLARGMSAFDAEWSVLHNFITTHYDGLAVGLLFASIQVFMPAAQTLKKSIAPVFAVLSISLIGLTAWFPQIFGYSLAAAIFGLAVWVAITKPESFFARAFSWSPLQIISRLSYGMYLWYRFPLWRIAHFTLKTFPNASPLLQYGLIFTMAFLAAVLVSSVTYRLIERPFLELRSRIYRQKERVAYASAG